ncbi:MAG: hypothetical protein JWQ59_1552 [Cryobacterium sp.]|nr:hypothetical protein [Cryobacterium sp.]
MLVTAGVSGIGLAIVEAFAALGDRVHIADFNGCCGTCHGQARECFRVGRDSLSAAGIVLADVWGDKQIISVDRFGQEFLDAVQDGQTIDVSRNGTVTVH